MADFWEYFKSLFQKASKSSPSNPLIHELIERSPADLEDYGRWKDTLVRRRLQAWLADQYAIFRVLPSDIDEAMDFLNTNSSKGFVIYFHKTQYSLRDITHFFDFLKEQVRALDYKVQISDRRTYTKGEIVESVERHYLKPRPGDLTQEKLNQRFGNISIELTLRNEKPYHLKLRATIYKDSMFKEGEDFKGLMQAIVD